MPFSSLLLLFLTARFPHSLWRVAKICSQWSYSLLTPRLERCNTLLLYPARSRPKQVFTTVSDERPFDSENIRSPLVVPLLFLLLPHLLRFPQSLCVQGAPYSTEHPIYRAP